MNWNALSDRMLYDFAGWCCTNNQQLYATARNLVFSAKIYRTTPEALRIILNHNERAQASFWKFRLLGRKP